MLEEAASSRPIRFGAFEVDLRARELRKHGLKVRLQEQPFQILAMLLERPGEVVTREELRQQLWPTDVFVDFEQGLNNAIKKLRLALGDSADNPRFVETLPRHGYRFIAPVNGIERTSALRSWPIKLAPAPLATVVFVVFLGVSYFAWRSLRPPTKSPAGRVMLAVLPFDNLSSDPEQDYFSDGLTEEMIAQLGGLDPQRLGVIARASAMQYKHSPKGATQIGRELGVEYILEGSVRREAGRARVTAQLIQVSDQTHLWAQSYERNLRDILALQKDVAGAIAQQIRLTLSAETHARLASTREVPPEAHEAYLKGLYFWNKFTVEGFLKSKDYFQLAIDKDPEYAPAYAGLAASYGLLGNFGVLPCQEAYPKSKAAAARAIELDERVSFAHSQLGWISMFYDHDWAIAEHEFRRAIEINPSNANAHDGYAFYFVVLGLMDRAEAEIQRARELDPLSLIINNDVGYVQLFARQYDQALRQLQQTLEMDAHFAPTHSVLTQVYEAKGLFTEANSEDLKAAASASSASKDSSWIAEVQRAYDTSGWKGSCRKRLELMLAGKAKGEYWPPYLLAIAYIQLGEKQKALDWLEKAAEEHYYQMVFAGVDPRFDSLRDEPRFKTLLRRMGLPP